MAEKRMLHAAHPSSQNKTLLTGIAIGVSSVLVIGALIWLAYYYIQNRPTPPPPTLGVNLNDPAGDLVDNQGQSVASAPTYLDITAVDIRVGDAGILDGGRSTGVAAGQVATDTQIALVTLTMASPIPQPADQDRPFALGVAIDRDGDPANNDHQTPGLAGTDITIGLTCDPQHSSCLEAISTFDGQNWTMRASEITWKIDGDQVKLAFYLGFLPSNLDKVRWRVFSSIVDPQGGGPAAIDVAPNMDEALATLTELE